jgi:hypothetical protein
MKTYGVFNVYVIIWEEREKGKGKELETLMGMESEHINSKMVQG